MTIEQARKNTLEALDLSEFFELIESESKRGKVGTLFTVDCMDDCWKLENAIAGLRIMGYYVKRTEPFTIHITWEIL